MKKYKIWGQIGNHSFEYEIEADEFEYVREFYWLKNSVKKQQWYFPMSRTVIEIINNEQQ